MPIRVLVADDHPLMRESMVALLASQEDLEVVGQAASGVEVLELVATLAPDVIVMDVRMPEMDGIEATRRLTASGAPARVVGVSAEAHDTVRERLVQAGATTLVSKEDLFEQLLPAIRAAAAPKKKRGTTPPRGPRGRKGRR
jgi:DNA-binding NarL/FixJ family response regulator